MRNLLALLILLQTAVFAVKTDYDYIIVGTSPFSMLEALYQYHSGHTILMVDESETYGGAWRSINVCGISDADMGCHEIGCQNETRRFLEDYVGCRLLSLDDPSTLYTDPPPSDSKGFYPTRGCYELVENLKQLVEATKIDVLLNHRLESVLLDPQENTAKVKINDQSYTSSKIVITPSSHINVENYPKTALNLEPCTTKHYHLYLLVEASSPPCFTYEDDIIEGVSRGANLTWYVGLEGSGMQLIVIQTFEEEDLLKADEFLTALKDKNYLSPDARILCSESYIYQQCRSNVDSIKEMGSLAESIFEVMDTWNFGKLTKYIDKWKQVLKPFKEAIAG